MQPVATLCASRGSSFPMLPPTEQNSTEMRHERALESALSALAEVMANAKRDSFAHKIQAEQMRREMDLMRQRLHFMDHDMRHENLLQQDIPQIIDSDYILCLQSEAQRSRLRIEVLQNQIEVIQHNTKAMVESLQAELVETMTEKLCHETHFKEQILKRQRTLDKMEIDHKAQMRTKDETIASLQMKLFKTSDTRACNTPTTVSGSPATTNMLEQHHQDCPVTTYPDHVSEPDEIVLDAVVAERSPPPIISRTAKEMDAVGRIDANNRQNRDYLLNDRVCAAPPKDELELLQIHFNPTNNNNNKGSTTEMELFHRLECKRKNETTSPFSRIFLPKNHHRLSGRHCLMGKTA